MIPLTLLSHSRRAAVLRAIGRHCTSSDTSLALRAVLEEFGDSFQEMREVVDRMETQGTLSPGLWPELESLMEGEPGPDQDWRTALRSVAGHS